MSKILCQGIIVFMLFIAVSNPAAGRTADHKDSPLAISSGIKTSLLLGHTTYHISYYKGPSGVESELEFPLKTYLIGPEIAISYMDRNNMERVRVNLEFFLNMDKGSERLKDSDWLSDDIDIYLYGIAHPGKDIYSESDIELDAFIFDINLIYFAYASPTFSIGPRVGYKHERFSFVGNNVQQVGYGPYEDDFSVSVPQEAIHYKVRYEFLYSGIYSEFTRGSLSMIFSAGAGYVYTEDRDDHILRYKLGEAETEGYGLFVDIGVRYLVGKEIFLKTSGQYLRFYTTGIQHQYFYRKTLECPSGGCDSYVSDRIDSKQWNLSFGIAYQFR